MELKKIDFLLFIALFKKKIVYLFFIDWNHQSFILSGCVKL
jgi:hypothetical protein